MRRLVLVACLALAASIAGCGDEETDPPRAFPPKTLEEKVQRAESCLQRREPFAGAETFTAGRPGTFPRREGWREFLTAREERAIDAAVRGWISVMVADSGGPEEGADVPTVVTELFFMPSAASAARAEDRLKPVVTGRRPTILSDVRAIGGVAVVRYSFGGPKTAHGAIGLDEAEVAHIERCAREGRFL
jgi:hypothetical protein